MFDWEFNRLANPTFIPYDSALDIVNGQSRFDFRLDADFTRHHNVMPEEIVEPLLVRLGYPPPPVAASISGPSTAVRGQSKMWTANVTNGTSPYTYRWSWTYECPGGGGDPYAAPTGGGTSGGGTALGPTLPCDTSHHDGGTGKYFTLAPPDHGTLRLFVIVTDATGDLTEASKTVTVSYSAQAASTASASAESSQASATAGQMVVALPTEYALDGASPNPSDGTTAVRFALPERADVRLAVYDLLGREVARLANGPHEAGRHTARFDGSRLPSGVYVVRLAAEGAAGTFAETERITLVR